MADCRLLPWFYSQLAELAEPPPFVPPDGRAREKWIKKTNVAWLRSHGLKVSGNAEEVKDRVAAHWDRIDAGTYPPSKPTPASDMGEFVSNFVGVVGRVMRSRYTPSHIEDTEEQIHNFLTKFKEIDESLGNSTDYDEEARSSSVEDSEVSEIGPSGSGPTKRAKKVPLPRWLSSYNGVSLLNIPDAMRLFGPLVDLYEGKIQGEGIVTYIRPCISQGIARKNWAFNAMKAVYRKLALLRIRTANDTTATGSESHTACTPDRELVQEQVVGEVQDDCMSVETDNGDCRSVSDFSQCDVHEIVGEEATEYHPITVGQVGPCCSRQYCSMKSTKLTDGQHNCRKCFGILHSPLCAAPEEEEGGAWTTCLFCFNGPLPATNPTGSENQEGNDVDLNGLPDADDDLSEHVFSNSEKKMYHKYNNIDGVLARLGRDALSVVIYEGENGNQTLGCRLKGGGELIFNQQSHQYERLGMGYCVWSLDRISHTIDNASIESYGLLLPPLTPRGYPGPCETLQGVGNSKIFTLITSDWTVLLPNGNIGYL